MNTLTQHNKMCCYCRRLNGKTGKRFFGRCACGSAIVVATHYRYFSATRGWLLHRHTREISIRVNRNVYVEWPPVSAQGLSALVPLIKVLYVPNEDGFSRPAIGI